jgi:hypothetical protein
MRTTNQCVGISATAFKVDEPDWFGHTLFGKLQYVDPLGLYMMLPSDLVLIQGLYGADAWVFMYTSACILCVYGSVHDASLTSRLDSRSVLRLCMSVYVHMFLYVIYMYMPVAIHDAPLTSRLDPRPVLC